MRATEQIDACQEFGYDSPCTHLVIKYNGDVDPDDTFSSIPYEKGFSLLWYLERIFGVDKFEAFLKGFLEFFDFHVLTSYDSIHPTFFVQSNHD